MKRIEPKKVIDLKEAGRNYEDSEIQTIYRVTVDGLIRIEVPKDHPDVQKIRDGHLEHLMN